MMCKVIQLAIAMPLFASLTLPFAGARPLVSVGVWIVVVITWFVNAPTLRATSRLDVGTPILVVIPLVLLGQLALDRLVPDLGSALVLFGNLGWIATIVRAAEFPSATIVRGRSRRCGR